MLKHNIRIFQVMFVTRVWHPQVDYETGKPCVDFLREQWKPTMGLRDVLVMLRQLLASPTAGKLGCLSKFIFVN